jgi:hypothetical protein
LGEIEDRGAFDALIALDHEAIELECLGKDLGWKSKCGAADEGKGKSPNEPESAFCCHVPNPIIPPVVRVSKRKIT